MLAKLWSTVPRAFRFRKYSRCSCLSNLNKLKIKDVIVSVIGRKSAASGLGAMAVSHIF